MVCSNTIAARAGQLAPIGAQQQHTSETAAGRNRELATDAGLLALSGGAGNLAKGGVKIAARLAGGAATASSAATAFSRGFDKAIAGKLKRADIDITDPKAVQAFAKSNPGIIAEATNQALNDAATGLLSAKAAGAFNKMIGGKLGVVGEDVVARGIEAAFEKGRSKDKAR